MVTNPTLDRLNREMKELEARLQSIDREMEALEKKKTDMDKEMAVKSYAVRCLKEALGIDEESTGKADDTDESKRVYVDGEKFSFMGRGVPIYFVFEGKTYRYESMLKMITKMMELVEEKDQEAFDRFLNSDLSKYRGDGFNNLSMYISNTVSDDKKKDWFEYKSGWFVKRRGLNMSNTMRIIETMLNEFSLDRHSFYIVFDLDDKDEETGMDEEEYEEDDPDQLQFEL